MSGSSRELSWRTCLARSGLAVAVLGGLWTARDLIRRSPSQPLAGLLMEHLGLLVIGWICGALALKVASKAISADGSTPKP